MALRIMTLNLRAAAADDGPNDWAHRWPHVRDLINDLRPNVLGLQECMPNQLNNLMGEVPGYFAYPGPDTMLRGDLSLRNPFFVCEPCNLPRSEAALPLNESGVIGQVSWDGKEPRLAHILRFDSWTLVNAHFEAWDCTEARLGSARLLVDFLKDTPRAVIMGDLNCTPDSAPIALLREAGFTLAKDSLPPDVDRRTLHKFSGEGLAELDYVLLRGITPLDVRIPRPRREAPYLSDHDPIVVDLALSHG
jgi:endonuclease/exonuclease/phosphatase family metal-dependent hydrolase